MKLKISKREELIIRSPLENKQFFIGVALGANSGLETGIVVLNRDLELIRVDKLFTNPEIYSYIKNYCGLYDSIIFISLAPNMPLLNSKWRQNEKNLHAFSLYESAENMHWADRFSERGKEIYKALDDLGIQTYRYNIHLSKMALNFVPPFKKRSQPGCKYLQTLIKDYLGIKNLPSNLIPIAALDAVIGAYTGWLMATEKENEGYKFIEPFMGQPVAVPLQLNPMSLEEIEEEEEEQISKKKKAKKAKKIKKR